MQVYVNLFVLLVIANYGAHASNIMGAKLARSVPELKKLASAELQIVRHLQDVQENVPFSLKLQRLIEAYLEDFEDSSGRCNLTATDGFDVVKNPILVYRLVRRAVYLMKNIISEARNFPAEDVLKTLRDTSFAEEWRNDALEDVMEAILRIHFVYSVKISEFATGNIRGVQTNATLRAIDCYEIGIYAKSTGKFILAVEWLSVAVQLSAEDHTVDVAMAVSTLYDTLEKHDAVVANSTGLEKTYLFSQPVLQGAEVLGGELRRQRDVIYASRAGIKGDLHHWAANYWGLCSGADFQTSAVKAHLFCWLETKINLYFTIGPLKMEFLSRNPDIVQFYNAVPEKSAEELVSRAEGLLTISMVLGDGLHRSRASSQVFMDDSISDHVVTRTAELLAGVQLKEPGSSELPQVVSYAIGGHYEPHSDSLLSEKVWGPTFGDRMATFMVYLSGVDQGGSTVFTRAHAAAAPVKGSGVLWFNTFSDGTRDEYAQHGACPVVLGQKWIATSWIRYNAQFQVKKCSINPKERFQFPVNGEYLPVPELLLVEDVTTFPTPGESKPIISMEKYSYDSIPGLRALAQLEYKIYMRLSSILNIRLNNSGNELQLQKEDLWLMKYLSDYGESAYLILRRSVVTEESVTSLVRSPVRAYRMIWRFENFIKKWLTESSPTASDNPLFQKTIYYLNEVYSVLSGPTAQDLNDAMLAIVNTQHILDLKAADISDGRIGKSDAGVGLKAIHCMEIGNYALGKGFYHISVDWHEAVVRKIQDQFDSSVSLSHAQQMLAQTRAVHDERHKASRGWEPFFFFKLLSEVSSPESRRLRKQESYRAYKLQQGSNFADINYWGLCQGNSHQTPKEKSLLFCWNEQEIHPSWKIGPLKAEIVSLKPHMEIVQYHDIISDAMIANLTNVPSSNLTKATVGSKKAEKRRTDPVARMSSVTWMSEKDFPISLRVSKLIERATRLKVVGTMLEDLQIAGYTAGSHYTVHPDSFGEDKDGKRARIATFMFYLNDVEEGGETAFCQAGVAIKPKKGSAVFWYNLLPSSSQDPYTWHGACPVVYGEKWVANKWIHYDMQTHLQCASNSADRFEILVNGKSKYNNNYQTY